MKKLILAGALIASIASPAFAQSFIPSQGTGNIAPMVTAANPDGVFRYTPTGTSVAPRRRASVAENAYAQDVTGSVGVARYSGATDPDPNIQFQLNREAEEGCNTEGC
ncbi:MAG: hypothetical protein WDN48_16910 [Pseudolabrys sp.]